MTNDAMGRAIQLAIQLREQFPADDGGENAENLFFFQLYLNALPHLGPLAPEIEDQAFADVRYQLGLADAIDSGELDLDKPKSPEFKATIARLHEQA